MEDLWIVEYLVKFIKNSDYYKNIKVSAKDAKAMVLSIDMQLEEMLRESNKTFDEYIENVDLIKNLSEQLACITTDIENDQHDEKHFLRACGEYQRSAITCMENLKSYTSKADKQCCKYFDTCERIKNLLFFRDCISSKCMTNTDIEISENIVK